MTNNQPSNTAALTANQSSSCSDTSCCPPAEPVKRAFPKVGRNDPCPCESGKKFKKCCQSLMK